MFMVLHREEKREEGDRDGQEDKRGNQKEREIEPVISSLSVLHSPGNTKRFTSWVEKIRGEKERERRPGGEKVESKGGESNQSSDLTPK